MSEWPSQIGLVGCGAMGGAVARRLARVHPQAAFVLSDAVKSAAQALADEIGGQVGAIADTGGCDVVFVAVKPKDGADALAELRPSLGDAIVVSVIAGWTLARLGEALGARPIVRTMPNLAVADGVGVVAVASHGLDAVGAERTRRLLDALGTVEELPEEQFSAATALAGSGPGFVALVAEGLEQGAIATGFAQPQARRLVQAVLAGTAALLADQGDPADLRRRVSSPGGTTVAGVAVLEAGAVRDHVAEAVRAAARRASEL